ncbi:MAG: hypothetical protein HC875_31010 [Anaerolineales bacterium]|nr:hypothetical protein [Anaerolineales bacterium]
MHAQVNPAQRNQARPTQSQQPAAFAPVSQAQHHRHGKGHRRMAAGVGWEIGSRDQQPDGFGPGSQGHVLKHKGNHQADGDRRQNRYPQLPLLPEKQNYSPGGQQSQPAISQNQHQDIHNRMRQGLIEEGEYRLIHW